MKSEPSKTQMQGLENAVRVLTDAMEAIRRGEDCSYQDEPDAPRPCPCPRCRAAAALEMVDDWRYIGSHYDRAGKPDVWPREAKMHAAWKRLVDDKTLSAVLKDPHATGQDDWPTARDWYVATSVVQWLATNVGMSVLEAAGFKYAQWEQDRAQTDKELMARRQERENERPTGVVHATTPCDLCHAPDRERCGHWTDKL